MKFLVFLFLSLSAPAFAQQGKVAVIPFDKTDGSRAAASRMAEMLAGAGRDVVDGGPVFEAVSQHRIDVPIEVAEEFVGVSERIAQGGNDFFYKGENQALEILSPLLELGVRHFAYLASRPDLVPQFYEAGLIVLRAFQGLKRPDDVKATANLLARLFPALSPSLKTAPPDVLEMMRNAKASVLENGGAKVGVRVEGIDNCRRYLNGTPIGDGSYPVASQTPVYVFVECQGRRSGVWELRLASGRNVVVPIVPGYEDNFAMSDDSYQSRRDAELVMQAIAFWGGFDEVVGLRQPATQQTAPTLFGHLREGHVTWTETRDVPAFVGFVEKTFDVQVAAGAAPETRTDYAAWSLVGGGALAALGGGAMVLWGNATAQDILCSGSALQQPDAGDCSGVQTPLSESEFETERTKANVLRIGGISLVGAGVVALAWGVWRLVDDDVPEQIRPTGGGISWQF